MSRPFLTIVKALRYLVLLRVVKITVKTSEKMPMCAHLGQWSKAVS